MAQSVNVDVRLIGNIEDLQSKINTLQAQLNKVHLPTSMTAGITSSLEEAQTYLTKFQTQLNTGFKTKGDVTGIQKLTSNLVNSLNQVDKELTKIENHDINTALSKIDISKVTEFNSELAQINAQLTTAQTNMQNAFKANTGTFKSDMDAINTALEQIEKVSHAKVVTGFREVFDSGDIEKFDDAYTKLEQHKNKFGKMTNGATVFGKSLGEIKQHLDAINQSSEFKTLQDNLFKAQQAVNSFNTNKLTEMKAAFSEAQTQISGVVNKAQALKTNLDETAESQFNFNSGVQQLGSRISYFFSAISAVQTLKKALTSAYNTVKELDAVMTETAVVTDFSIGDMWDQLPTYAENASKLGVSIKSAYESATLYYQQGLKTNQVMEISNQTLKMARIAGLDAEEATNRMTNAMRGFNMELNNTSAERISDVYSKLAAITASNVDEISTAMTKVASLANSANMSFENTSAFLSQIIETTRESADTAGTALKTVIARFAEMKQNPAEILNVDGEEVSYNKVDEALKSIGISLDAFMNGTEGLDSVFMRLSARWDTLDVATQRYIATMAAGSRQQSRFIALMQDYGRMQELTGAAMNSSGTAAQQYAKTLDSIQSKLAQLKNQWDEFTMDLMNSDWLKSLIDLATSFLSVINGLTEKLGGIGSSIAKIGGLVGGFFLGGKLVKALGNTLLPELKILGQLHGQEYMTYFWTGAKQGLKGVKGIGTKDIDMAQMYGTEKGSKYLQSIKSDRVDASENNKLITGGYSNLRNQLQGGLKNAQQNIKLGPTSSKSKYIEDARNYEEQLKQLDASEKNYQETLSNSTNAYQIHEAQVKAAGDQELLFGQKVELTKTSIQDQQASLQQSAMAFAMLSMVAATAISTISNYTAKTESSKKAWSTAAEAVTTFGTALMLLPSLIKAVGLAVDLSFPWLLAISAGIAIAFTAIKRILEYNYKNSLQGKIESTAEALETLQTQLDDTTTSLNDFNDAIEQINGYSNLFDDLIEGSAAFNEQLLKNNQAVLDLITKYPELSSALTSENGILGLDKAAVEAYNKQQQQKILDLTSAKTAQQARSNMLLSQQAAGEQYAVLAKQQRLEHMLDPESLLAMGATAGLSVWGDLAKNIYQYFSMNEDNALNRTLRGNQGQFFTLEDIVNKINEQDNITADVQQQIADEFGVQLSLIQELTDTANKIKTDTEALNAKQAQLIKANLTTNLDTKKTGTELGTQLIDVISKITGQNYVDRYNEVAQATGYDKLEGTALKKKYSQTFQISEEQLADISEEAMKSGLIGKAMEDMLEQGFEELYTSIEGTNSDSYARKFAKIFSGQLDDATANLFDSENINTDQLSDQISTLIEETLNETGLDPNKLAKDLGLADSSQLESELVKSYSAIYEAYIKLTKQTLEDAANAVKSSKYDKVIKQLTVKEKQAVSSTLAILENIGYDTASSFLSGIEKAIGNATAITELTQLYSGLNAADVINTYANLNAASLNTTKTQIYRDQATQLKSNEAFGFGKQLQQYLQSSDYIDKKSSILKKINSKNGLQIDDIKDLANESSILATMLENGAISAGNLRIALQKLQLGKISVEGLTNRVVESIDAFNSLETSVNSVAESIKNASFGNSSAGLITSMDEQMDDFQSLIQNNGFGDLQTQEYLKYFYNEETAKKIYDGTEASIQAIKNAVDELHRYTQGNGINFWDEYSTSLEKQSKLLEVQKKNFGSYIITLKRGATTEAVVADLMEKFGFSTEFATAMLAKLTSLNPELGTKLKINDYISAMEKFAKTADMVNGKLIIGQKELQVLQEYSGRTSEQIVEDAATLLGTSIDNIITVDIAADLVDANGKELNGKELMSSLAADFNSSSETFFADFGLLTENGFIDYDKAIEFLQAYGATEADANRVLNASGLQLSGTAYISDRDENGNLYTRPKEVVADTTTGLITAIENAEKDADYSAFQTNIKDAIVQGFEEAFDNLRKKYPGFFQVQTETEVAEPGPVNIKTINQTTGNEELISDEQYKIKYTNLTGQKNGGRGYGLTEEDEKQSKVEEEQQQQRKERGNLVSSYYNNNKRGHYIPGTILASITGLEEKKTKKKEFEENDPLLNAFKKLEEENKINNSVFLKTLLLQKNTDTNNATPSNATPSNATPSNATPSNATPSNATPSNATPSNATPSEVIRATESEAIQENTKTTENLTFAGNELVESLRSVVNDGILPFNKSLLNAMPGIDYIREQTSQKSFDKYIPATPNNTTPNNATPSNKILTNTPSVVATPAQALSKTDKIVIEVENEYDTELPKEASDVIVGACIEIANETGDTIQASEVEIVDSIIDSNETLTAKGAEGIAGTAESAQKVIQQTAAYYTQKTAEMQKQAQQNQKSYYLNGGIGLDEDERKDAGTNIAKQIYSGTKSGVEALQDQLIAETPNTGNFGQEDVVSALEDTNQNTQKIANTFDKLYNITKLIEANQQAGDLAAKAYNNLLNYSKSLYGDYASVGELVRLNTARLQSLETNATALEAQRDQASRLAQNESAKYSDYMSYDAITNKVQINWEKINSLTGTFKTGKENKLSEYAYNQNKEEYDNVKEAISKVEGYAKTINDSNSQLFDIQAEVEEIKTAGASETQDLVTRVASALKATDERLLQKTEDLLNSVDEANSKILSAMQEQISEQREQRNLTKTQVELEKKRRKLAYLQQDTSGSNRQEILALQKEINDSEENYTDSLIDSAINKLEKQNEKQNEANARMIALQEKIIQYNEDSGAYAAAATIAIMNSFEEGKYIGDNSPIARILRDGEQWQKDGSIVAGMKSKDLATQATASGVYLMQNWNDIVKNEANFAKGSDITALEGYFGMKLTGSVENTNLADYIEENGYIAEEYDDQLNSCEQSLANIYSSLTAWIPVIIDLLSGQNSAVINTTNASISSGSNKSSGSSSSSGSSGSSGANQTKTKSITSSEIKTVQELLNNYFNASLKVDGIWGSKTTAAFKKATGYSSYTEAAANAFNNLLKQLYGLSGVAPIPHYATGGLADFTGPAWLDGTVSKPELVLNANDTQIFLKLVDILRNMEDIKNTNIPQNSGSVFYDIDINIDEISDEESVEMMINKVKQEIVYAAKRNNFILNSVK